MEINYKSILCLICADDFNIYIDINKGLLFCSFSNKMLLFPHNILVID